MARRMVSDTLEKVDSIIRTSKGSYEDLEKMSQSFTNIHTAILDEEAKYKMQNHQDIDSMNFSKLQLLAYDIEELLERWIAEALTSQKEVYESEDSAGLDPRAHNSNLDEQGRDSSRRDRISQIHHKVSNVFLPCLRFTGARNFLLALDIRSLKNKLEGIPLDYSRRSSLTEKSLSSPEAVQIFGRDADKKRIIDLLSLNDQYSFVISIVGAAGLGKTTLAQFVYDDERVVSHFDERIWVKMSESNYIYSDMARIYKSVRCFSSIYELSRHDPLRSFGDRVRKKRFLIVLDDVSIEDTSEWGRFRFYLDSGAPGSRILLTTRTHKVAREAATSEIHYLQPLDDDASWSLFSSVASWDTVELKDLERLVVKIIGGVPLFAKTWATKVVEEGSAKAYLSDISAGLVQGNFVWEDVFKTLTSVYVGLPPHLKPCLQYCSLFPKGCWIVKEVFTQLWMAEGFVALEDEMGENMEEIGREYFDDLLAQTSFFKDIERDDEGNIVRCKMHEPFHDFVCHISRSGNSHAFIEDGSLQGIDESTRHSSILCVEDTKSIPTALPSAKSIRTFLCFGNPQNFRVPRELFSHWKVIRVSDLSSTKFRELSYSIGTLKHLRYLDLSYTRIKKLPASICGLCFLQTLKLSHSLLRALPNETRKMVSLRHLEIDGTCMNYLPRGMERLTRIQKLSDFIVGAGIGCSIGELGNLNLLQGKLITSNLNRFISREEAEEAKLDKKYHIDFLILDGKHYFGSKSLDRKRYFDPPILEHMYKEVIRLSNEIDVDENEVTRVQGVFEGIKPHVNLRRLEIWNYIGLVFPNWMKDGSLTNLVFVKLVKCVKAKDLPPLGNLPFLKCLHIRGMVEVENISHGFYGDGETKGFPKLEHLVLEGMPRLEVWDLRVEEGHMPCVAELIISDCPCLKTLPNLPNSFRKLEIYNCEVLCKVLPSISFPTVEHMVLKGKDGILHSLPSLPKLKSLKITLSSELTSLPIGFDNLKTLKTLAIHFCPKLGSFPQELRQLTMLQELCIIGCPLLTEQYNKRRMDDWMKNIPNIEIDNKKIKDLNPAIII